MLLGSSRVLLEKGLSESLAGRFEEIRMSHWSYQEMKECLGFSLDQYMFYGGYPGAATLIDDEDRFSQYIQSAIIEATINKDILMDTPISKPALLRQTFELVGGLFRGIAFIEQNVGFASRCREHSNISGLYQSVG